MWQKIKAFFITDAHNDAMLRREVEEFHNGLGVNGRQSTAQIRRRERETGDRLELVERTNEELVKFIERIGR